MNSSLQVYGVGMDAISNHSLKALVVDDSDLQRRILSVSLQRMGYQVYQADSGHKALEICKETPPDLVVSDWMMPEMDGLEFCRAFRAMPRDRYGYFILLTSKGDKGDIAMGLDCGADDFLTKPVNQVELRARLAAGERIVRMQVQLQKQNHVILETLQELTTLHDALDHDLRQARKIQHSLLPPRETILSGSRISVGLKSCGHVGGDLVGLFDGGNNQIGMYNIDVSGHGITSALMTARIGSHFSEKFPDQNLALVHRPDGARQMRHPAETARMLNERLLSEAGVDQYFTMAFAAVDLATGRTHITQAGHPSPIWITKAGEIRFLGQGGFPVGLLPDVEYDQFEITLQPGDRLLFCSDGITEAQKDGGAYLTEDDLRALIHAVLPRTGKHFIDGVYMKLCEDLPKDTVLDDDVSAIMLEFQSV